MRSDLANVERAGSAGKHCSSRARGDKNSRSAIEVFLVVVIIGYIMPWPGANLLAVARDVATLNLPARVGQLFGVSL